MEKPDSSLTTDKPVRVYLIDKFRVLDINDTDITPTATKARCLLAVLILENSGKVSREKVSQLLWSRHASEQARASLRQSLSVLRQTFDKLTPGFISADRSNIYIQLDKVWLDTQSIIEGTSDSSLLLQQFDDGLLEGLNANDPKFANWLALKKESLREEIKTVQEQPTTREVSDKTLYRTSLLKKVREFWIDGLLENTLVEKREIELALKEGPEHLLHPWDGIVPQPHHNARLFPADVHVLDVFETLHRSMLVLGSPGSGKTTLLLNLAKELINQAEENESSPIPVVLHLSTWSNQYTNLRDWIVDELDSRYQMPARLSSEALDNQSLLLLLDGLDEVDINFQINCIEAINKFQSQPEPVPIVVCSRESNYIHLSKQLALAGAVVIQPISTKQLDSYLHITRTPSCGLSVAIIHSDEIKELLTTPLMLNIATTAYQNYREGDSLAETPTATAQDQLFLAYVESMFEHRKKDPSYSPEQTTHWLGCLARTLIDKKQSLFYLDQMQPDWAGTPLQRWIVSKGSVYICGVIVITTLGALGWNFFGLSTSLPVFLALGIGGCYLTARWGYGDRIDPVSRIQLSLRTLRNKFYFKLINSTVLGSIFSIGATLLLDTTMGITLGSLFFLLLMITNSLDFEKIQYQPSVPNETIKGSLYNALMGLTLGTALGAGIGLFTNGLQGMVFIGITFGIICSLFFGGHACIQHYLLRYFMWRNKTAPLRYIPFLEFSVNRAFLYRVGGGYLFMHRSLAEYFAKNR